VENLIDPQDHSYSQSRLLTAVTYQTLMPVNKPSIEILHHRVNLPLGYYRKMLKIEIGTPVIVAISEASTLKEAFFVAR